MKVRKYFRGSGRILAFVFIASVIWLLFDMAALRVSINDVNSKFLKERFVKEREAVRHRATRRTYLVNRVGFKNQKQKVDLDLETEVIFPNKMDNRVYKQRNNANPAIKTSKLTNHKPPNLNMGVGVAKHDEKESSNLHLKAPLRPTTLHVSKNVELLKDQRIILDVHKVPVLEVERGGMDEAPREIPVGLPNLTEAPPGVQEEKMQLTQFQKDEPEELNRQINPVLKAKENILDKGSKILDKDIFKVEIEKRLSSLKDKQENTIKPERKNTREKDKVRSPEDKPNSPQIMSGTLKNETVKQLAQTVAVQNFPPGGANGTHSMGLKKSKGMHRVLFLDVTQKPRESDAVGQFGHPAVVPKDKEQEMRERWNEGHFNVYLSEQIPVDRAIPDTRPQTCSEILVHDDLPTTSVIFCFVDEVWSTLLRSVHSVLNRSPPNLLEEIILVDDFSTKDYLKEQLDKYMSQFPKVRILRLKERQGLIRARLAGAAIAKGEVLTFLDSHVECNVGWLEPLLERVYMDRKKVACPVIEVINDKDMSYVLVDNFQRGIFKWPLVFGWNTLSQEVIRKDKLKDSDPIRCPVMAGGLFAIDRKYFYELGTYDPGLDVWGGENMEISFKIWMCGGEIEIIPCSRVGHIFRSDNPYKFPKDRQKTVERNLARVAEVWLDEYKDLFYGHGYHHLLNKGAIDIGNLTDQIRLREKLQCKSFRWYLENIYPDLEAPLVRAQGLIFSLGARKCVALEAGVLSFNICDLGKQSQNFNLTWLGHVQQKSLCLAPHGSNDSVVLEPCDNTKPHLRWRHKSLNSALVEHLMVEWGSYHQCLEANAQGVAIYLRKCDPTSQLQKWQFTHYFSQ